MSARVRAGGLALAILSGSAFCASPPQPHSLMVITIDTLRADHTSAYGADHVSTPTLEELARRGVLFRHAVAPSSSTAPSHTSMFTGRLPSWHSVGPFNGHYVLDPKALTLAEILEREGYQTAAIVSNAVLRAPLGLDQGFDLYDDQLDDRERNRAMPERRADHAVDRALAWLRDAEAPFFLWLHLQDPHGPYDPRSECTTEIAAGDDDRTLPVGADHSGHEAIPRYQVYGDERRVVDYVRRYACEIESLDAELARLVAYLDETERWSELLLVLTSDHGEALGEDGFFFAHSHSIGLDQVRVPLIVVGAGVPRGRRVDGPVSNVSLFSSTLQHLGFEVPDGVEPDSWFRMLEANPGEPRDVFVESLGQIGVLRGDTFLRRDRYAPSEREIWSEGNPNSAGGFWRPLGSEVVRPLEGPPLRQGEAGPLEETLSRFDARARVAQSAIHKRRLRVTLTPEHREALRALGYAE